MNSQPIEKQDKSEIGDLEVHSIFKTIQGEGPFTGTRSIFVRLAGCNLQCPLCDTDYTSKRIKMTVLKLITQINELTVSEITGGIQPGYLIVITGGEPFRQNLKPFIDLLLEHGYNVQIETNGTLFQELPYDLITVVCSPKTFKINRFLKVHINALKYIAKANDIGSIDGLPLYVLDHIAEPCVSRPPMGFSGTVYIQPADEGDPLRNHKNLDAAITSVMKHGYTLCLQTHKIIGME